MKVLGDTVRGVSTTYKRTVGNEDESASVITVPRTKNEINSAHRNINKSRHCKLNSYSVNITQNKTHTHAHTHTHTTSVRKVSE